VLTCPEPAVYSIPQSRPTGFPSLILLAARPQSQRQSAIKLSRSNWGFAASIHPDWTAITHCCVVNDSVVLDRQHRRNLLRTFLKERFIACSFIAVVNAMKIDVLNKHGNKIKWFVHKMQKSRTL